MRRDVKLYNSLQALTGEQGEKALSSAVDDVDFVETDRMHNLLSLLQLSLGTLHKLRLGLGSIGLSLLYI